MHRVFASIWRVRSLAILTICLLLIPVSPCRAADPTNRLFPLPVLSDLLFEPDQVDAIFVQVVDRRHGQKFDIPIPPLADQFIPAEPAGGKNTKPIPLRIIWRDGPRDYPAAGLWRHRTRSAAGQLTIHVPDIDVLFENGSVLLLARRTHRKKTAPRIVECHVFPGRDIWSDPFLAHFGLTRGDARSGVFGMDLAWSMKRKPVESKGLQKFLTKFDVISAGGFTPTLRSGSTGIGYTLETLLDIKENNSPRGDFMGIELKSHRGDDFSSTSSRKMNLFLKEPKWLDGLSHKERIPKYGYVDDNGRTALYSTVTNRENSHGLKLKPDGERVLFQYRGKTVAAWTQEVLAGRLQEKLKETIFVGAQTRGSGRSEEFHFQTVLYCREPSAERLARLIANHEAMVEMRMHIRETGSARNHGTAFRIRQNSLPGLFSMIVLCRAARSE